jgi:uncharacterized BrkB/YihY/UPF0761 family membrane protein
MENEILQKIEAQNQKLDAIYTSVEKTRKTFQMMLYVTVGAVVLPLIGLLIGIPFFINSYLNSFEGLL